jgi:mannose-6-phosphate isomerase
MPAHRGHLLHLPPNRVWRTYPGGRTLDRLAGVAGPADSHFAEDWIASTTRALNPPLAPPAPLLPSPATSGAAPGLSAVRIGTSDTLRDFAALLASDPGYFLGEAHVARYGAQPQLLVKFLDSGTRLHFQVHPTREFARRVLGAPSGKTEAYHVLAVREPGEGPVAGGEPIGYIYVGFQRPPAPAQLRDWIVTQNLAAIEACFDPIPVRPGDTFIVPGGTPHALGAGVFMVEIQEPSDLVVRFEFERAGFVLPESARFMNRDVDFALRVFDFTPLSPADLDRRIRCRPRRLRTFAPHSWQDELIGPAQTDCFRVHLTHLGGPVVKDENAPVIAIVTAGTVIAEVGGATHRLRPFDKVFLPAHLGPLRLSPADTSATLLECLPPPA